MHGCNCCRRWRPERPLQEPDEAHVIVPHWDGLLRIAGSLRLGTVRANELMRTLQRGNRLSELAKAIGELERIAKTVYFLTFPQERRNLAF